MLRLLVSIFIFNITYLCPQSLDVEKRFYRVIETVQIRSAENIVFYDVFRYR